MWMPGSRPVIEPIKIPRNRAIINSSSIYC
jgi:hypothetical protein